MPMWLVDSLGILVLVCKENKFVLNVNVKRIKLVIN